jgi:Protein of unknown function (DUF2793)
MTDSPNLVLPYLEAAQAQKHVTHNEALSVLDVLVQLAVLDRDLTTPPATPANGDRYLVAASPAGAWTGQAGRIAAFQDGGWTFHVPRPGWLLWIADEAAALVFNGAAWIGLGGGSVNPTPLVGVNATADTTNRLAVKAPASLFDHDGAGHQLKLNKATAANTASLLFQSGYSGRAEFGLTGDDDLHVKVSSDGTTFFEALWITAASGLVTAKSGFRLDPAAADPSAPANGQLWYNSTSGTLRSRQNGVNIDLGGSTLGDGDKGDISVAASGATWTLDAHAHLGRITALASSVFIS